MLHFTEILYVTFYLTLLNMRNSKYLMFLFTKRNTGGNHPKTLKKYDILTGEFEFEV